MNYELQQRTYILTEILLENKPVTSVESSLRSVPDARDVSVLLPNDLENLYICFVLVVDDVCERYP